MSTKKLIVALTGIVVFPALLLALAAWKKPKLDEAPQFLWRASTSEIEAKLGAGPQLRAPKEVATGNTHFRFYERFPYRGLSVVGIYCYEQNSPDNWILRGYFPVNTWPQTPQSAEITYASSSNMVQIVCRGNVLFSVSSLETSKAIGE